jgi:hypothetical protein
VSVFAAGAASVRGNVAGGGSIFDNTPATDKWREQMRAAAANLGAKYSGDGPYRVADVLADVDHWWHVATEFSTTAKGTVSPANLKRAQDNALNLLEARAELRLRVPTAYSVTADDAKRFAALMVAPIEWLIDVGDPILTKAEEPASMLKRILWIGLAFGGVWAVKTLIDSGVTAKREIVGERPLFAPKALVRNPPPWAADPILWEQARVAVEPHREQYDNPDAVTVHVYKQLGGRVS